MQHIHTHTHTDEIVFCYNQLPLDDDDFLKEKLDYRHLRSNKKPKTPPRKLGPRAIGRNDDFESPKYEIHSPESTLTPRLLFSGSRAYGGDRGRYREPQNPKRKHQRQAFF